MELPSNTLLQNGKYKIIKKIGQGGFGIAYKAYAEHLKKDVCVKEFFFSDLCERAKDSSNVTIISSYVDKINRVNSFKKKFIKEAQRLAQFQHPNIVQVTDVFEENNTAYYVMEYLDGGSFEDLIKQYGALSEQRAKELILPIIDALEIVHKANLLHLDINPKNIMLRRNQSPVLIDFGISKYLEDGSGNQNTKTTSSIGYSEGYSPIEQSSFGSSIADFTKATDIYSICATIYKMVTGFTPPTPNQIITNGLKSPKEIKSNLSANFNAAIVTGMSIKAIERPQTCFQLRKMFGESIKDTPTMIQTIVEPIEPKPTTAIDYFKRAEIKREGKKFNDAIVDYTEAIKLKSSDTAYYFNRAVCYNELKKYDEAIKDYIKVIELNPKEAAAYNNRGCCYSALAQKKEAEAYKNGVFCYEAIVPNIEASSNFYQAYEISQEELYFNNWISAMEKSPNIYTLNDYISKFTYKKDKVLFLRGKYKFGLGKRDNGIEDLNSAKDLGNNDAIELLKSTKWYTPKIFISFILLFLSNILLSISLILNLINPIAIEIAGIEAKTILALSCIPCGLFSLLSSVPFTNHGRLKEILHSKTSLWFQFIEKINLSVIFFILGLLISYVMFTLIMNYNNNNKGIFSVLIVFLVFGAMSLIPYYGLRYIWKKKN
jgi:serine/threonine protein kinase